MFAPRSARLGLVSGGWGGDAPRCQQLVCQWRRRSGASTGTTTSWPRPAGDLVVAPRAAVGLHRLVRLDVTDFDGFVHVTAKKAQPSSTATITNAATTIAMSVFR